MANPRNLQKSPVSLRNSFPAAFAWGAVFAIAAMFLAYLGVPPEDRAPYIIGCVSVMVMASAGLVGEWRKALLQGGGSKTIGARMRYIAGLLWLAFVVLVFRAGWLWIVRPAPLVFHMPLSVEFGSLGDDNRIYVRARVDNTLDSPIQFEAFGKALVEPPTLSQEKEQKIERQVIEDARMLASGLDVPEQTIEPNEPESTTYDFLTPDKNRKDYGDWLDGKKVVYYATDVYVIESNNQVRFALHKCGILKHIIVRTPVALRRALTVYVNHADVHDQPCDKTVDH